MLQRIKSLRNRTGSSEESGFTLLELIIVVVVLGLIVGIAIPIFSSQTKSGVEATLKSDIRNSAMVIMTEASKNQGRMPQWLPNYATKSPDNQVVVVTERSNQYAFCLMGTNAKLATVYYYSSVTGELSEQACPSVANGGVGGNPVSGGGGGGGAGLPTGSGTGLSWSEQKQVKAPTTKALMVAGTLNSRETVMRSQLLANGYGEVRLISASDFIAMTDADVASYDLLVATWNFNALTPGQTLTKITNYYNQGGRVLQDGNDSQRDANPFIDSFLHSGTSGSLDYKPTNNSGLNPTFMYTFEAKSYFPSDSSWRCVTSLKNGAVSIATAEFEGSQCIMAYAGSNSNGGRWAVSSRFMNFSSGVDYSMIEWLRV